MQVDILRRVDPDVGLAVRLRRAITLAIFVILILALTLGITSLFVAILRFAFTIFRIVPKPFAKGLVLLFVSFIDTKHDHVVMLEAMFEYIPEDKTGAGLGDFYRVYGTH